MEDEILIRKLGELKQIKPRKDWVLLTKKNIFKEEKKFLGIFSPSLRPAFPAILLLLAIGLFATAGKSLPGEPLYAIKKFSERAQTALVPQEKELSLSLELANKRLEELEKITINNDVKKLAPAIKEFQAAGQAVAKQVSSAKKPDKEIVMQTVKLEEGRKRMETLGIAGLELSEESDPTKLVAEMLIKDTEERTLDEAQIIILEQAKTLYQEGNYYEAIIKISVLGDTN